MAKGMLIDTTRCTGCRGCQTACKQWNLLPAVDTEFSPTMTNPPDRGEYNYNHVEFHEVEEGGNFSWNFVHRRCLHCLEPTCVEACPINAIKKLDNGPVVVDKDICIGIQHCYCPFDSLRFQDRDKLAKAVKCTFCWNRLTEDLEPACAKTCPSNCIEFGERGELLSEARSRIQANSGKYYNHIYGEHENGGTSIMYLTAVAPEKLGLPAIPAKEALVTEIKNTGAIAAIGAAIVGLAAFRIIRADKKPK